MAKTSLAHLLAEQAATRGTERALLAKQRGRWISTTWGEFDGAVARLALGLRSIGLAPGERVAVIGPNSSAWVVADLAVQANGAATVGILDGLPEGELARRLRVSSPNMIVVHGQNEADAVLDAIDAGGLEGVRKVLYVNPKGVSGYQESVLASVDEVSAAGGEVLSRDSGAYRSMLAERTPDDIASVTFTSGTTGDAHAVLQTAGALVAAATSLATAFPLNPGERALSYLPLADPVERAVTVPLALATGAVLAFPETTSTRDAAVVEIAPAFLHCSVRYLTTAAATCRVRMQRAKRLKQAVVRSWTRSTADGKVPSALLRFLVGFPVLEKLGLDKARFVVASGAGVPKDAADFFRGLGLDIRSAYGSAETGGLVLAATDAASTGVGSPLPGVEVRVSATGELLVKGPTVATTLVDGSPVPRDSDGYFPTGDLCRQDGSSYVILGRAADTVQVGTRTVNPAAIEAVLAASPYLREVVVAVTGTSVAALVEADMTTVGAWAQQRKIAYTTYSSLVAVPEVVELLRNDVSRLAEALDPADRPDRIEVLDPPLSVAAGELTPTGKLRRATVIERRAVPAAPRG